MAGKANKTMEREGERPIAPNWFRLGFLVHDVSRMRRTLYDQHLKALGITRSQWWVLANISRHPEHGVMSATLGRNIDIGKVTLSGIIDRLEVAGYIYRRSDKVDKRAKRIFITESGYQLIDQMREVIEPLNKRICEGMSLDEIRATEDSLANVKANLKKMLGEDLSQSSGRWELNGDANLDTD
ncbi:MarR family winged helix-turn-helix transcriptional regulator [Rhizorhabdus argentea]|uniref:MarR family winged helix-turn-helix transcriptional regulator n=1 Tax=Rhizorhabdus argentea TaxID=1387174 RepID=UPI0030EF602D